MLLAAPHPTNVSARWTKSVLGVVGWDTAHRRRLFDGGNFLLNSSGANITNARNEIATTMLATDADWLWFFDTDMVCEPDILDRLIEAAHPEDRPVLGALCFSLQDGWRACPTLYVIRDDGKVGRVFDYPEKTVMRVLTGTGCLLIHRTVLEKMQAQQFSDAYPWFQETKIGSLPIGEDITFCLRAESIGIPVHVDTGIECGHEKTYVIDSSVFKAQQAAQVREHADPIHPTFAVIASKNRPEMLTNLMQQLEPQCKVLVFDNGYESSPAGAFYAHGLPLHNMWNLGIDAANGDARGMDHYNVLIINDDVEVAPDFVAQLEAGLRSSDDNWIACPGEGGMTGWAFMLRGEAGLRLDEQFEFWYGDTDIAKQATSAGKNVVSVPRALARHLDPMKSTFVNPERLAQALRDEQRYAEKWNLDPSTLWLARNADKLDVLVAEASR